MADQEPSQQAGRASQPIEPAATVREVLAPYAIILVAGLVIAVGVLAYVALYRDEILAILTQSPT
jgi:hypothetical protein